jgi:AGCS family alanine or glycine:cation symporter
MERLADLVSEVNNVYWYLVIVLLVGAGLWFSFTTLVVQIRMLPEMVRTIGQRPMAHEKDDGISPFRAFTISAASRVGTGNVAGVAVAIALGGPGAIFWMWALAIIGGATAFVESTLAQLYKVRGGDGFVGGPAYYIRDGLRKPWLAVVFAVVITFTYGFVFNAVQANSISASVQATLDGGTGVAWVVGLVVAAVTGAVIFGGVRRLSAVTEILVPLMALAYIAVALVVVALNIREVPGMIALIVQHALGLREVGGAAVGAALMHGMRRGLFSNEAGMGSVPNAAATASVSHPVKQGLVQALGVYFDTIVVCSATAFIILLSDPRYGVDDPEGIGLTQSALEGQVGAWAGPFLSIVIFFLAWSSILGNSYYGEANIRFLAGGTRALTVFRVAVMLCVLGGALGSVQLVWNLADLVMGVMATINLIAIIPLGGLAVGLLRHYLQEKAAGREPHFHRSDLPEAQGVTMWDEEHEPVLLR